MNYFRDQSYTMVTSFFESWRHHFDICMENQDATSMNDFQRKDNLEIHTYTKRIVIVERMGVISIYIYIYIFRER